MAQKSRLSGFIDELRRRRVFRVAAFYGGIAFVIVQIIDGTFDLMGVPQWVGRVMVTLLAIGFPVSMILAWVFDITPEGIVRTEGRAADKPVTSNRTLIAAIIFAMAFGIWGWMRDGGGSTRQIRSIAVIPLENLMNDPDQDYFVSGMHEALTSELSKISELRVIGRTSTLVYKANPKPIPEIAEELNVDAVIEGSVLRDGDRVRITVQLVATRPERHLWTKSYDRDLRDILSLHSDVARAIAREIEVAVTTDEEIRRPSARHVDPEAYASYLKGRYEMARFTAPAMRRAIDHFQESTRIDPGYAPAHAGLSIAYMLLTQPLGAMDIKMGFPMVRKAAESALELDPQLAEGHTGLGWVHFLYDWDWEAAGREFRRAVELDPNSVEGRKALGFFLSVMGRSTEAIPELEKALDLDPLSLQTRAIVAEGFLHAREFERAITGWRNILELDPGFGRARSWLRRSYEALGRFEMAIETYAEGRLRVDTSSAALAIVEGLRHAYATGGQTGYWEWWLERSGGRSTTALAALHRVEELLTVLEQWEERRSGNLGSLRIVSYDPVRDDPRFQVYLKKMRLD